MDEMSESVRRTREQALQDVVAAEAFFSGVVMGSMMATDLTPTQQRARRGSARRWLWKAWHRADDMGIELGLHSDDLAGLEDKQ